MTVVLLLEGGEALSFGESGSFLRDGLFERGEGIRWGGRRRGGVVCG